MGIHWRPRGPANFNVHFCLLLRRVVIGGQGGIRTRVLDSVAHSPEPSKRHLTARPPVQYSITAPAPFQSPRLRAKTARSRRGFSSAVCRF